MPSPNFYTYRNFKMTPEQQNAARLLALDNQFRQLERMNRNRLGVQKKEEEPHPDTLFLMYVGEHKDKPIVNKLNEGTFIWSKDNNWTCEVPWKFGRARADNDRAPWWVEVQVEKALVNAPPDFVTYDDNDAPAETAEVVEPDEDDKPKRGRPKK